MNQEQNQYQPPAQPEEKQQNPVPPTGQPGQSQPVINENPPNMDYQATGMPSSSGGKTWILIVVLLILLIAAGLIFASWQGWIGLGGLEKYWTKDEATTTTANTNTQTTTKTENTAETRDAQRKSDIAKLKKALKDYFQGNQSYPKAEQGQKTSDANTVLTVLVPTNIASLPLDPLSPTYYYSYTSDGKTFDLTARLEDTTDPTAIKVNDQLYIYKVTDSSVETNNK